MIKFHAKAPATGQTVAVAFGESGPSITGEKLDITHLGMLLNRSNGPHGKPIETDSMNAHEFAFAMESSSWKTNIVEGDLEYEPFSESLSLTAPVEPISIAPNDTEIETESNIFDSASLVLDRGRVDSFADLITGASSFDEIEEIFHDAIDEFMAKEQKTSLEFGVKAGQGAAAREALNAKVVQLIDSIDANHILTDEERELLASYTGRGGLKGENSETEYYTPQHAAESTWEMLKVNGFSSGSVGEPSCGSGIFLGTKPPKTKVVANELSNISAKVTSLLNPDDDVENVSFEEQATSIADNSLDAVIGNVPFSKSRPYKQKDPAYADRSMTLEQYFIERSIDKVRFGGLVGLLIPTSVIERKSKGFSQFRRDISLKAEFLGAVRLPSKTFKKGQHGTEVPVDVILLKKHPKALIETIKAADPKLLSDTRVFYDDFIEGRWFTSAGKRYVLGEENREGAWNRLKVNFDGTKEERQKAIRTALSTKFDSRIDWAALESAPVELPVYAEGDSQMINGAMHELENGKWVPMNAHIDLDALDESKYGADSMAQLRDLLSTPQGCLTLSFDQIQAIDSTWANLLRKEFSPANAAFLFATDSDGPAQEIAWRGSLLGQIINRYDYARRNEEDEGEQLEIIQKIVSTEIHRYGNPHKAKVKRKSKHVRDWMLYQASVQKNGGYNALLRGEVETDSVASFDASDPVSIIHHLTAQTIQLFVQPSDVLDLYTGLPAIRNIHDLIENERIALTATGTVMTMEHYLSGDLYKKLQELNTLIAQESDMRKKAKYVFQRDYILENRPYTPLKDVNLKFTDRWADPKYIEEFLELNGINFTFHEKSGRWNYEGAKPELFEGQLLKHLNRGYVLKSDGWVKQKGGGKIRGNTSEATAEYRENLQDLTAQFNEFMRSHEDAQLVAEQYNSVFNTHMPVVYSESPLGLDNLSGDIVPHGFQNSTVRRMSDDGKGIIGLDVGLGKTFTALALVQYNIQNNRSKRNCIAVPKAVLANWYHEARAIHKSIEHMQFIGISPVMGDAGTVLREQIFTEKRDGEGNPIPKMIKGKPVYQDVIKEDSSDEIKTKMWAIPQSNHKVFVMTQTQHSRIPLRPETREGYTDEMVSNEMLSKGTATDYLMTASGYSAEKRKKVEEKVAAKAGKKAKDFDYKDAQRLSKWREQYDNEGTKKEEAFPYYEDMRFDTVVVDEAHNFKNIYEASETRGLKYLAATDASQRGTDMAIKMNYLKKNNGGRGPIMLTATPITNSPIEVFNALSLVTDMSEMERMGVKTPDDFVDVFASKGSVEVQKLSGMLASVEGIVGFENLTALRNLFNRFAVVKSAKEVTFDNGISPPDAKEHQLEVDLNPEQQNGYEDLRGDLRLTMLAMSDPQSPELFDDNGFPLPIKPIFSIMRQMEKLSTDVDLFHNRMTWRFPIQHRALVETLVASGIPKTVKGKRYDPEAEKQVTTTIPRLDPIELNSDALLVSFQLPVEFEDAVLRRLSKAQFAELADSVSHPLSSKYAKVIANIKRHINEGGKQIIFTEEKSEHQKLKRILSANTSLESSQVGVINATTAGDPEVLQSIADSYNRGDLKLVLANRKAEVGVNLQKGTSAIHHLTLPWTPASIQQRNGRGVRQGNEREYVDVYYYVAKGSMDINRLAALKAKANWIDQIMKSDQATMENPDAASEASAELMRLTLGDDAYEAQLAKMEAIAAEKKRKQADRSALTQLAQLSKTAQKISAVEGQVEKELAEATKHLKPSTNSWEKPGYHSIEQVEKILRGMSKSGLASSERYQLLKKLVDEAKHKIKTEQGKLNVRLTAQKSKLEARESLPFSREILSNPASVLTLRGANFALYEGCYVRIVPFKQKGGDFNENGIYKIRSISKSQETIHIERFSGDYHIARRLKGNSRSYGEVPFTKWPLVWKPIAITPEFEMQLEIHELNGSDIGHYFDKFSKEDLIRYGSLSEVSPNSNFLFNDDSVISFGQRHQMSEATFANVIWPDPSNDVLVERALDGSRKEYGPGSSDSHLGEFLKRYVGGENYMDRYNEVFKIKSFTEAEAEYTAIFTQFMNAAPDDILANPEALFTWMTKEHDADNLGYVDRYVTPLLWYNESLVADGYSNQKEISGQLDIIERRFVGELRRKANRAKLEREDRELEAARVALEAEQAKEKAENDAKTEADNQAFTDSGGIQLNSTQKASFARKGLEVEIITKDWEYPSYKGARGRTVKGVTFPAGKYLKLEGVGQRGVSKGGKSNEVADRFASPHGNNGLYRYPRTLSIYMGREGEEITLTPINDIVADVEFYLELLDQ